MMRADLYLTSLAIDELHCMFFGRFILCLQLTLEIYLGFALLSRLKLKYSGDSSSFQLILHFTDCSFIENYSELPLILLIVKYLVCE